MAVTYKAGPFTIATCSGDLGTTTAEGIKITEQEFNQPVKVDQKGPDTKVDAILTGKQCRFSVVLSQWGTESINAAFPMGQGVLQNQGKLIVQGGLYKTITLTPTSDGGATDIYAFKRAYPEGPVDFNLQTAQRLLPVTFEAYLYTSSTVDRFYTTSVFSS